MNKLNYKVCGELTDTAETVEILNPETNEVYKEVPVLSQDDIDAIYTFATNVQKDWKKTTITKRSEYLLKWADNLLEHQEELADILVKEIAKSYNDAKVEVQRTADYIRYTVEEMYRLDFEAASSEQFYGGGKNKLAITKREPLGVILAISPFNYPVNLAVAKLAPAIASGNTVVFKPATQGSVVGIRIIELLEETNIPAGVVNVVTGRGREIGYYLVEKEEINMISFTGGSNTGERISKIATMVPQVMELGGKDAAIVMNDANLDFVAKDIIGGAFNYSGQRCTAIKRVLVHEELAEELTAKLIELVKEITVGAAIDSNTVVPLISESSADYVAGLIEDAKANGSKIEIGGERENNLIYPTIISNVKRSDRVAIEEPFGPLLPIITYKEMQEAIEIHNESEFGLQATIYGKDIDMLFKIGEELEAGTINFNGKTSRGPDNFPFIGYKKSGMGVQGIKESLKSMTKPKTTVININD